MHLARAKRPAYRGVIRPPKLDPLLFMGHALFRYMRCCDACLHAECNPRVVKTPSKWQTRQPIYRSSVARWRRYEPWLGTLRALVDESEPGRSIALRS